MSESAIDSFGDRYRISELVLLLPTGVDGAAPFWNPNGHQRKLDKAERRIS